MSKDLLGAFSLAISVFNFIAFLSIRPCWSGISELLGCKKDGFDRRYCLPAVFCILQLAVLTANLTLFILNRDGKVWQWGFLIVGFIFLFTEAVIILSGAIDFRFKRYYVLNFAGYLAAVIGIGLIGVLIFTIPDPEHMNLTGLKYAALILCVLAGALAVSGYAVIFFRGYPVVYAVEDEYQIVFSTASNSTGWVTIGGKDFFDLNSGNMSVDRIHKVCVKQSILDSSKEYTVNATNVIYRGPFGGMTGKTIHKTYSFKPVNSSKELSYFNISDVHVNKKGVIAANFYAGKYDFLVDAGDSVWMSDSFADANYENMIAGTLSKGEIPVVFARGNHNIKGKYSSELYRFVGSKDQKFYYRVTLGNTYILVLDLGEAHDDTWWEFNGTAKFDEYRQEQIDFIKRELEAQNYRQYRYKLCVCHIPIVYINDRHDHEKFKGALTELLNMFPMDMGIWGHEHELLIFTPGVVKAYSKLTYNQNYQRGTCGGCLTDFHFPSLMVGKQGYTQKKTDRDRNSFIGLFVHVNFENGTQNGFYVNSKGEKVTVVDPFTELSYGSGVTFQLHREKLAE